ncbi:MAG: hypothetical protein ABIN00_08150 [candidate division WOR-3 bacterium]
MLIKEEKEKIEEFIRWLDQEGFNFSIIDKIRELFYGTEKRKGVKNEEWLTQI